MEEDVKGEDLDWEMIGGEKCKYGVGEGRGTQHTTTSHFGLMLSGTIAFLNHYKSFEDPNSVMRKGPANTGCSVWCQIIMSNSSKIFGAN